MSKCFICQNIGHFMKHCSKREGNGDFVHIVIGSDIGSYDNVVVLVVSNLEIEENSIIESGYSYHMCSRKKILCDFEVGRRQSSSPWCDKACMIHVLVRTYL